MQPDRAGGTGVGMVDEMSQLYFANMRRALIDKNSRREIVANPRDIIFWVLSQGGQTYGD